jgi:hypothetical protein
MTKAVVVFADGSKSMSRNLDDSGLRWYERKVADAKGVRDLHQDGILIRDCSLPENQEQALNWRAELKAQLAALTQQRQIMQLAFPSRVRMLEGTLQLRIAIQEVQGQLGTLKNSIRTFDADANGDGMTSVRDTIHTLKVENREMRNQLIDMQAKVIWLQSLLIEQLGFKQSDLEQEKDTVANS